MKQTVFGTIDGAQIMKYTLANAELEADIITLGATITALRVPNGTGGRMNVVTGHATLEDYLTKPGYMGAVIGRFGNRIEKGQFSIDGQTFHVSRNEGQNTLHGGNKGFDKAIWQAQPQGEDKLVLTYRSPDGEEGFPGNMDVTVTYSLTPDRGLRIDYTAVSDRDTVVNLTNHAYFNVSGVGSSTTDGLLLRIDADRITPADEELIPHGQFRDVEGTLFDFRTEKPFICDLSSDPVLGARGCYDENFVLQGEGLRTVAKLTSPVTGVAMEVLTDQPGMQIYTGNPDGVALETQNFPNAVNCPEFPSALLRAGQTYRTSTIYRFC